MRSAEDRTRIRDATGLPQRSDLLGERIRKAHGLRAAAGHLIEASRRARRPPGGTRQPRLLETRLATHVTACRLPEPAERPPRLDQTAGAAERHRVTEPRPRRERVCGIARRHRQKRSGGFREEPEPQRCEALHQPCSRCVRKVRIAAHRARVRMQGVEGIGVPLHRRHEGEVGGEIARRRARGIDRPSLGRHATRPRSDLRPQRCDVLARVDRRIEGGPHETRPVEQCGRGGLLGCHRPRPRGGAGAGTVTAIGLMPGASAVAGRSPDGGSVASGASPVSNSRVIVRSSACTWKDMGCARSTTTRVVPSSRRAARTRTTGPAPSMALLRPSAVCGRSM